MKYNYFSPGKAGKYLIREMFLYNNKTHCLFCCGTPPVYLVTLQQQKNSRLFDWYWEDDITGELVHTTHTETKDILRNPHYDEVWYPVPTNGIHSVKKLLKDTDIKASSTATGSFYKCFHHAFDSDIIVNPLVMLGYVGVLGTNSMGKLLRNHRPNLVNIPIHYVLDEFSKRKNIVTHKEDIRELARNLFIGNGHIPYKDPNWGTETSEKYFQQVTKLINHYRNFERDIITCLDYYNISYDIFNLDKDDYKQRFNLDQVFSKTHDPMLSRYDFIEPCDVIEGWIDTYMRENP